MPKKRGQPPKPPEKSRTEKVVHRYTPEEKALLQRAWEASGSPNTLSRWLADQSMEKAKRIIKVERFVEASRVEGAEVDAEELLALSQKDGQGLPSPGEVLYLIERVDAAKIKKKEKLLEFLGFAQRVSEALDKVIAESTRK